MVAIVLLADVNGYNLFEWIMKRVCLFVCFRVGKYHCPVTFKIFNENSHIVAIAPTGNVFSWEVRGKKQNP